MMRSRIIRYKQTFEHKRSVQFEGEIHPLRGYLSFQINRGTFRGEYCYRRANLSTNYCDDAQKLSCLRTHVIYTQHTNRF